MVRLLLLVKVLLLKILTVHLIATVNASPSTLFKVELTNSEAVCNDGSKAVFYVGAKASDKWIIFFESGGLCSTREECNERYMNENTTVLMTSKTMPSEVEGKDFLSADEKENPKFHDYSRVLVPYCSSDLWLGSKTNSRNFSFIDNKTIDNFSFRGRTIFQGVIFDLMDRYNLSQSDITVLAGSSAGAIGVLNHARWVKTRLQTRNLTTKLLALIDSGWFINFKDSMKLRSKPGFAQVAGINPVALPACADLSLGFPCCLSASCLLSRKHFPPEVQSFVVFSLYDIYMLAHVLKGLEDEGKTVESHAADYLSAVSMYGGAMNESVVLTESWAENMSYFVPACFQHTYFCTSSLWDKGGQFQPLVEVTRGSGRFR